MTVSDLISDLLTNIRNQWYADQVREFKRDERALTRAIARYGYACDRNHWPFEPAFIQKDILDLLQQIKRTSPDIAYFPLYLEGAIDRHLRQRAEELSEKAKTITHQVNKTVAHLPAPIAVREPTHVELMAHLYKDLQKKSRRPKQPPTPKQASLL